MISPQDDYVTGQRIEHITNMTISAENKVDEQSQLKLDAGQSTTLIPGFEVSNKAILEVNISGCRE